MKLLSKICVYSFFMFVSYAASAQVLFNNFLAKFDNSSAPFALDENYMVHQLENPRDFQNIDPIFLEFVFDEAEKDQIFKNCGGYDNLDSCFVISFISKLNLSTSFHTVIYSERSNLNNEQEVKYFLSTFTKEGQTISNIEIASLNFENGKIFIKEGYIFDDETIFSLIKSYSEPSKVLSLGKVDYKLSSRGKIADPVIKSKALENKSMSKSDGIESRP